MNKDSSTEKLSKTAEKILTAARAAFAELKAAGGDRKRAGWLEWEQAEKELA